MAHIFHFGAATNSARNRGLTDALGIARPLEWRVLGLDDPAFIYRGVIARPHVALLDDGRGTLRIVHLSHGAPNDTPTLADRVAARFSAHIAAGALRGQGIDTTREVRVLFADRQQVAVEALVNEACHATLCLRLSVLVG
ncbi:hypothetical protein [Thiocystis violacea]|uniref:hypothetical protein n=1 Tax=Thiocystis violacea TaxID=13725 RepID=UPI0019064ACB|nr:hypothetical protein [Thiocystis violacea]MBK1724577.1 hypothetical protein [Thiocystis violacea]